MSHLKTEEILAYVAGKMAEKKAFEVNIHLATCEECAKRVKAHYYIKDHFDTLWDTWTAKRHAEEYWQARVGEALKEAEIPPRLGERVKDWLGKISQKADVAIGVVIDASQRMAEVVQEGFEALRRPDIVLEFSSLPAPVLILGEEPEEGTIKVEAKGPPWTAITVEPTAQKITVQMEVSDEPWPLLLLFPKMEGKVFISEFSHPEGTDYLLAEFEDVPDGEFTLVVEPMPSDDKKD